MLHRMQPGPRGFPVAVLLMLACMAFAVPMVASTYAATHLVLYPAFSTKWVGGLFAIVVLPGSALAWFVRHRDDLLPGGLVLAGWAVGLVLACLALGF